MKSVEYQAFVSYSHEDNDRQGGRLLSMVESLKDEFAVITGDELDLFVDRRELNWGDIWRQRIDDALNEVPFFLAIITPKFVRSAECRRELLAFSREAGSRGLDRLLLPIVFIDVEGLSEDSDDEVLSIIARTQFESWSRLRLLAPHDPAVLQAVNRLALSIRDRRREAQLAQIALEHKTEEESKNDLDAILQRVESRWDSWLESVEFDQIAGSQWRSSVSARTERLERLQASRQPHGPKLAVIKRLGLDLLPIATNRLEKAKNYAKLTIELDADVTAALRSKSSLSETHPLLVKIRDGIDEAYRNINPPAGETRYPFPTEYLSYSQSLVAAQSAMRESLAAIREANEIVLRWRDQLLARTPAESDIYVDLELGSIIDNHLG